VALQDDRSECVMIGVRCANDRDKHGGITGHPSRLLLPTHLYVFQWLSNAIPAFTCVLTTPHPHQNYRLLFPGIGLTVPFFVLARRRFGGCRYPSDMRHRAGTAYAVGLIGANMPLQPSASSSWMRLRAGRCATDMARMQTAHDALTASHKRIRDRARRLGRAGCALGCLLHRRLRGDALWLSWPRTAAGLAQASLRRPNCDLRPP